MVKLGVTACVLIVAFGVFSMLAFLSTPAFGVAGHAISWKLICLAVLGWVVYKRVK